MARATVAESLREFLAFIEILDDAYWEASTIEGKDTLYDIISIFNYEVAELNKLSVQDHHYSYEIITEGMRRVLPKLEALDEKKEDIVLRTRTLLDFRLVMSSVIGIMEGQV